MRYNYAFERVNSFTKQIQNEQCQVSVTENFKRLSLYKYSNYLYATEWGDL